MKILDYAYNKDYIVCIGDTMRTTLDLNETLLTEAMKWTGETTKTATINEALKQIIKSKKRVKLVEFAGKLQLDVDLDITRKRNGLHY
ncbi:MAG: type II toxin-antitoxin system VapB family antitoxin [Treponema sp.]|nr:type II toxin-antitoxin system VapB family antitoxin [Treponema sp.]